MSLTEKPGNPLESLRMEVAEGNIGRLLSWVRGGFHGSRENRPTLRHSCSHPIVPPTTPSIGDMNRASPPGATVQRLAHQLVDRGPGDPIVRELAGWLASPRFRSFAEAHRDKIRKKLRTARDPE